jgi:hypothetical protein
VGQFNLAATDLKSASGIASSVATRLVAASKGDSWNAMKTASASLIVSINSYRSDRDKDPTANDCSPLAIEISAANDTVGDSVQGMQSALADSDETIRELDYLYDRIRHLYSLLNFDYKLSNTKEKHMVDFSTGNALITEQISVADNWTPFADPTFVALPATGPGSAPATKADPGAVNKSTTPPVTAAATIGTGAAATNLTLTAPSVSSAANAGATAPAPATGDTPMTALTPAPQTTAVASKASTTKTQGSDTAVVQSGQILSFDAQPSLWRKLLVHFVATGGAFAAHEPTESYTAQQLPTTVITTVISTVTTTPTSGTPTTSTTNESTTTTGTENLPFRSDDTKWHTGAVVGITWFPAAMDTYSYGPRSEWRYDSFRENFAHSFRNLGFFLGSTVNTSGTFTFGPAYQVSPGIEVLVGGTLLSSDSLDSGASSCHGLGSALTSNTAPPSTVNDTAVDPTSGTETSTMTTTTVTTETHCINADATVLSDTNVPKQTDTRVGFSFGILLNSNLFKAFGWTK